MPLRLLRPRLFLACLPLLLAACASPPLSQPLPFTAPPGWRAAPLPHEGSTAELARWWTRFDDPALAPLQAQAQAHSPTLALAAARLRQARAESDQARALLLPQLQAQAQASRGAQAPGFQASGLAQAALSAGWEIDLFGAQRAQAGAAGYQAQAAEAQWHEARVSLAADVAVAYLQLRHAQAQEEIADLDALLAAQLTDWGRAQQRAGLASGSDLALLGTQQAAAQAARAAQRAEAQVALQRLALLTAQEAAPLAERLAPSPVNRRSLQRSVPKAPAFALNTLPAGLLAQRPDLLAAHRQWLAAQQAQAAVDAQAWPQLSLGALIGQARFSLAGPAAQDRVWSIGPSLSLPLFDGGLRRAQSAAAAARTEEGAAALQARWRQAVGEVEDALQRLHAAAAREREVTEAEQLWQGLVRDATLLAQAGVQSGPQRAATQRQALAAQSAATAVRLEHALAWVQLYRTLGGGWSADAPQ